MTRLLLASTVAIVITHFLGSKVGEIMTTGRNLVILEIFIFFLIFIFRRFSSYLRRKSRFLFLFVTMTFFCLISRLAYFLRIYLSLTLGPYILDFVGVGGGFLILHVSSGDHSGSSEDSFGLQVLSEPWPVNHNIAWESSLRNRILCLESDNTVFLLDKEKGAYWGEVKQALDQASSQLEYNQLLEFENRDLQIREQKHKCFSLFQRVLNQHPSLAADAPYNPKEVFLDYLTTNRDTLDQQGANILVKDQRELHFLKILAQDLETKGPKSPYFNILFEKRF